MREFIEEIRQHCEDWYPREACGILGERKNNTYWFPCENISKSPENNFSFNINEYREILKKVNIIGIVHSHPADSADPSQNDIKMCNSLQIPYYIFAFPSMKEFILLPERQ